MGFKSNLKSGNEFKMIVIVILMLENLVVLKTVLFSRL